MTAGRVQTAENRDRQQRAFALANDGWTHADIAAELDITKSAASGLIHRERQRRERAAKAE